MITEKQLLKWGFKKVNVLVPLITFFRFVIAYDKENRRYDYVEYWPDTETLDILQGFSHLLLKGVTTKRRADQALHLLGLPSIDKLNTIKK